MADKPILFSGPMVRALLAGTKTQTRRVLASETAICREPAWEAKRGEDGVWRIVADTPDLTGSISVTRVFQPGDRLYVREHWRCEEAFNDRPPSDLPNGEIVALQYEADGARKFWRYDHLPAGKFRQGMHMPKWASRITLHVSEVRVQRLQDISDADAIAEGIELVSEDWRGKHWRNYGAEGFADMSAVYSYRTLWNMVHGHTGEKQLPVVPWSLNPWVTATTFEVECCNIELARAA